jgi:hypothetical protein
MCVALAAAMTTAFSACSGSTDDAVADALQEAAAVDGEITVAAFPAYDDARTRADYEGRHDKTSWDSSDVIYIRLNGEGKWYTLTYDEASKAWSSEDLPTLYREDEYEAVYAPNYEPDDDNGETLELKEGATVGAAEYMTCSGKKPVTIAFKRDYSRFRIYCGAKDRVVNVSIVDSRFRCVRPKDDNGSYVAFKLTSDDDGNAYLYGTWTSGTNIQVTTDGMTTKNNSGKAAVGIGNLNEELNAISSDSENNKSYFIDNSWVVANIDKCDEGITDWSTYTDAGYTKIKLIGTWDDNKKMTFEQSAFKIIDLSGVKSLKLPDSMFCGINTGMGNTGKKDESYLESVILPEDLESISDYCFFGCDKLSEISIPSSVKTIGYYAFYKCSNLVAITIPSSVLSIGSAAFRDCTSLTSINIPSSLKSISIQLLYECSSLTSLTIPSSVISICGSAFGYSGLTSIVIPSSVTSINTSAFWACESLEYVYSKSSAEIKSDCFYGCSNLKAIILSSSTQVEINSNAGFSSSTKLYVPEKLLADYKCSIPTGMSSDNVLSIDSDECKEIIKKLENNE